jgi:methylated-DNA-[protein]-cysteine S-methyltransferase
MYYSTTCLSPVGELTLASDGQNLVGLWITTFAADEPGSTCGGRKQKYFYGALTETPVRDDGLPVFKAAKIWLEEYFAGMKPDASKLPLAPLGSEFRQGVWWILRSIPYGEVTTYGALAKKMAIMMRRPTMSAQAVGGAVGHNPVSIIIPCHRVVGADGSLTGYAAGIETKMELLELEGVDIRGLRVCGVIG